MIWSHVNSKKFFLNLINLLKIKDIKDVQIKLLSLIQKWGLKFEPQKNAISNFTDIYNRLKNNGVEFPENNGPNYNIYFQNKNIEGDDDINDTFYYLEYLTNILKEKNFQHKYRRLVAYLLKMNENIKLANIYIDSKEVNKLEEIINVLKEGNNILKENIIGGRLKDEKLMEFALTTNEDIRYTLSREEEFKKGINEINKFVSSFEKNNIIPRKKE